MPGFRHPLTLAPTAPSGQLSSRVSGEASCVTTSSPAPGGPAGARPPPFRSWILPGGICASGTRRPRGSLAPTGAWHPFVLPRAPCLHGPRKCESWRPPGSSRPHWHPCSDPPSLRGAGVPWSFCTCTSGYGAGPALPPPSQRAVQSRPVHPRPEMSTGARLGGFAQGRPWESTWGRPACSPLPVGPREHRGDGQAAPGSAPSNPGHLACVAVCPAPVSPGLWGRRISRLFSFFMFMELGALDVTSGLLASVHSAEGAALSCGLSCGLSPRGRGAAVTPLWDFAVWPPPCGCGPCPQGHHRGGRTCSLDGGAPAGGGSPVIPAILRRRPEAPQFRLRAGAFAPSWPRACCLLSVLS